MTAKTPSCPSCASERINKNGRIHNGKHNHQCKSCGRQFVENPQNKIISRETKELIDKRLLETLPLAGIARVAGVSEPWLQGYVNQKYEAVPNREHTKVSSFTFTSRFLPTTPIAGAFTPWLRLCRIEVTTICYNSGTRLKLR